jgi:hypothetical protein
MPTYICKRCSYETTRKSSMDNHINKRQIPCQNINNIEISENENIYITKETEKKSKLCGLCKKEFYNSRNRKKHELICKFNKIFEEEEKIVPVQIINNYNINGNVNITLNINSFNDPIIGEYLEDKIKKHLRSLRFATTEQLIQRCIPVIFNMIYFNENIPENHSISILEKDLLVYDGKNLKISKFDKIKSSIGNVLDRVVDEYSTQITEIDQKFNNFHEAREKSENKIISFRDKENEIIKRFIRDNGHISFRTMKKNLNLDKKFVEEFDRIRKLKDDK